MSGKEAVLRSVRAALGDVQDESPETTVVARDYVRHDSLSSEERVHLFAERVADYKVTVRRAAEKDVAGQVASACKALGVKRLVIPVDLPEVWLPEGLEVLPDDALSYDALDAAHGTLTGCALAVAQTGTIALDGGAGQGRRALTLLPDFHLCIVYECQIVGSVPEALTTLEPSITAGRPVTFISGPSATSDIELNRVEGVHGPRTLEVLLVAS